MGKLLVEYGEYTAIAKIFDVSHRCVRNACKGRSTSDLAKRIRMAAIERGGVEVEDQPKQKIS